MPKPPEVVVPDIPEDHHWEILAQDNESSPTLINDTQSTMALSRSPVKIPAMLKRILPFNSAGNEDVTRRLWEA